MRASGCFASPRSGRPLRWSPLLLAAVLLSRQYLSASPYLERWKYDSFGAAVVCAGWRPAPVRPLALRSSPPWYWPAGGGAARATREGCLPRACSVLWLALYFGGLPGCARRPAADARRPDMHRFVGGVHLAALMLIAVGGDRLWALASRAGRRQAALFNPACPAAHVAALIERHAFYRLETTPTCRAARPRWPPTRTPAAILDRLKRCRPADVRRPAIGLGQGDEDRRPRFSDLLTFERIAAVSAPYRRCR